MSRRKKIAFALAASCLSVFGMLLVLLAADLVMHHRAERSAGLNRYGYRGPVVGRKQPGEVRVVMLGGSTVFGYGVTWNESVPSYLEPRLRARLGRPVSVINLGYNNEGAYSFVPNLEDFAYLDYDAIVLYEGYNDLLGDRSVNTSVYRRASAVFRLTGYFPILPLYLDEKVMMLRHGKNLTAAYAAGSEGPTVFRPTLVQRTSAGALAAVSSMTKALDAQLSRVAGDASAPLTEVSAVGCSPPWVNYCESVAAAVRFGRARGDAVVVGSQPRLVLAHAPELHSRQQAMLAGMVQRNFSGDEGVVWADLSGLVDVNSPTTAFDGMHLNPHANAFIAAGLVEPLANAVAGAGIHE
jgi:hypothetical protein